MLAFSLVADESEINALRGALSQTDGFCYGYGDETANEDETLKFLRNHLRAEGSLFLTAREDADFAGFCAMDTEWRENGYAFLREIFVFTPYQNRGIGEEFMRQCIAHAKKLELCGIVTETAFENLPMRKWCETQGFLPWDNDEWKEGITYKLTF